MSIEAPVTSANPAETERNGMSVLDLTKHAALTILESLDENDRLGIVASLPVLLLFRICWL